MTGSATQAAQAIAAGTLTSAQLVETCLARIAEREPLVQAWQFLDTAYALEQARMRDEERAAGLALGPLHGVPVGIKDIIDTADMPTENGTVLHAGRQPQRDAAVVALLRAAGAVILGKTVTTECATYAPGKTRHPQDPSRSPGGSSSGSAAAVADGMVPLALGTQTNASVVRPAAFCGVYGFKPSHGLVPRRGILALSRTLDCVGLFARGLDDIALLAEVLVAFDAGDPDTRPRARIPFVRILHAPSPNTPRLAFVRTPLWERADAPAREAFEGLRRHLGADCEDPEWPTTADAWASHRTIMEAEMAAQLDDEWQRGCDQLSPSLREQLARGREIRAFDYQKALAHAAQLRAQAAEAFMRIDAILTPAACGTAPPLASTGDPAFGTLWTLCGLPAISLPLLRGADGLPLGVQLVGAHGDDARLLQSARWLEQRLNNA